MTGSYIGMARLMAGGQTNKPTVIELINPSLHSVEYYSPFIIHVGLLLNDMTFYQSCVVCPGTCFVPPRDWLRPASYCGLDQSQRHTFMLSLTQTKSHRLWYGGAVAGCKLMKLNDWWKVWSCHFCEVADYGTELGEHQKYVNITCMTCTRKSS